MAEKFSIKPFNSSLDKKKLREYFAIAQLKDGQFWGVKEGGITHREEFTEGTKPRPEQIPFLMKRSSYYMAYMFRHMYGLKAIKKENSVVLDLGCAAGFMGQMIHRATYIGKTRYIGIDAEANSINTAQKTLGGRFFLLQDHIVGPMPYIKDESVDVVYAMEIIEHMNEKQAKDLIKELGRIMKPDARLVLSTPNSDTAKEEHKHWDFHPIEYNLSNMEKMLDKLFNVNEILGWSDQHSNAGNVENYLGSENRKFFKAMSKYVSAAALRQIVISMFPEHATAVIFDCTRK